MSTVIFDIVFEYIVLYYKVSSLEAHRETFSGVFGAPVYRLLNVLVLYGLLISAFVWILFFPRYWDLLD